MDEMYEKRKKTVYDFMCDEMYVPMKIKELAIVLGVTKEQRPQLEQILEELTGRPVRSLAFPNGSYSDLALEVAADYYDYCYTTKSYYPTVSDMEISRYYIARDMGEETFLSCLGY